MGTHGWEVQCPQCGFEHMLASSYNSLYFEAICPICGYARWTEEKIPPHEDVELARRAISEMSDEERDKAIELYYEDNLPFIARLNGKHSN